MAQQGDLPRGDLTVLTNPTKDKMAVDFWKALRDGQGNEARVIINSAYDSGVAVETRTHAIIAPAMKKLGHDWEISGINADGWSAGCDESHRLGMRW